MTVTLPLHHGSHRPSLSHIRAPCVSSYHFTGAGFSSFRSEFTLQLLGEPSLEQPAFFLSPLTRHPFELSLEHLSLSENNQLIYLLIFWKILLLPCSLLLYHNVPAVACVLYACWLREWVSEWMKSLHILSRSLLVGIWDWAIAWLFLLPPSITACPGHQVTL